MAGFPRNWNDPSPKRSILKFATLYGQIRLFVDMHFGLNDQSAQIGKEFWKACSDFLILSMDVRQIPMWEYGRLYKRIPHRSARTGHSAIYGSFARSPDGDTDGATH